MFTTKFYRWPSILFVGMCLASTQSQAQFSPTDISGGILWLDGADVDGDGAADTGSDGTLIDTWVDKASSNDVLRPMDGNGGNPQQFFNALNGNSVVRFTDDLAKLDSTTLNVANDYSVFTVVTHPTVGGGRHVFSGLQEPGTDAVLYTNAGWRFYSGPGGSDLQISAAPKTGTRIFGYQLDSTGLLGGDLGFFGDRDTFSDTSMDWVGTGTLNGIRIGGINRTDDLNTANAEGWLGDIAEVLIYDRPLDVSERSQIASYLQEKWYAAPLPPDEPAPSTAYTDTVMLDGPLHYYRFEETHTDQPVKDHVATDNQPGTFGAVEVGRTSAYPNLGVAAEFSGTGGSLIDLGTPFHPASGVISIEAWVNLDVDAPATFLPIAARWDGSYELDVNNNAGNPTTGDGRLNLVSRNDGTNTFGIVASPEPLEKGAWKHVVGTFEDGVVDLWIDGVNVQTVDTGEQPTSLQDAGATLFIGSTRDGGSFNWDGLIDEVAFYDYALSSAQIQAHIQAAVPEPSGILTTMVGLVAFALGRRVGDTNRKLGRHF